MILSCAKKVFIEIVDFMFYDGKIKDHTLKEITSKTKVEVSNICTKIVIEIENKFPNLIDETEKKYSEKKNYFVKVYKEAIEKYCSNNKNKCDDIKNEYEKTKEKFSKIFSYIKDTSAEKVQNIKDRFDDYYTKFKNE